jgi:organic radical activating enzyme
VPVLLETNGTSADRLRTLLPFLSIVSMDVKLPSNSGERPFWEEHRAFLEASRGKTVYVKVPVDESTREEEVARAAALVAAESPESVLFLQPIVSPAGDLLVSGPRVARFHDVASRMLDDVRVLPQTHKVLGVR